MEKLKKINHRRGAADDYEYGSHALNNVRSVRTWHQSVCFHVRHHDDHRTNKRDLDMNVSQSREKTLKNSLRKSDARKEVSVAFHGVFPRAAEPGPAEREGKHKSERPKSANYCDSGEKDLKKRPASSEPLLGRTVYDRTREEAAESRENKLRGRESCCCCCCHGGQKCGSLLDFHSDFHRALNEDSWSYFRHLHRSRKCRSSPSVSKTSLQKCDSEKDLQKVKRSLRLLGFEPSELGMSSDRADRSPGRKSRQTCPALSTRVTSRSISLDSLREAVKRAWLDDRLDESHRRILARAAYEEWYFRKEREMWEKREEERMMRMKAEENLRVDFQRKKEKSEEEFQKWLQRKRMKRKEQEEDLQKQKSFVRLKKSEEESEKAFIKWKRSKEKEIMKRKIEKMMEEERKKEAEKQKHEKRIIAEKAFQQWKAKLEESEKLMEEKRRRLRRKQELEQKRRREEGCQISFEMWKAVKDEQIKRRMQQIRAVERMAREERLAQMEERMYEAEQAFEDWLERVDLRRQKGFGHVNTYQKNVPWIPA